MLLLVLLAGGASMAISAVLSQQRVNRNLTDADLSTQNAVAATAAHIANGSSCAPANAATPDSLLRDTFQSNIPPLTGPNGRWSFPAGGWQVQQDQLGNPVLASTAAGPNVATPNPATYTGAGLWRNYRVTVGLRPMSDSTTVELDAYYQGNGQTYSAYWLRLQGGNTWRFGRTPNSTYARSQPNQNFNYDSQQLQRLELDVFAGGTGTTVTARLNDRFLARQLDQTANPITEGNIAIQVDDAQVQVASVSVDQPVPAPKMVLLSLPNTFPSPAFSQFYCQRLGGIDTSRVSQRPAVVSSASSCAQLNNVSLTVPAGSSHLKVWFTVPWPDGVTPTGVTLSLGGCPGDPASADCGRQLSTVVTPTLPWSPGLTMVGADCANQNPSPQPRTYTSVYVSTSSSYSGSLLPMAVRAAPSGAGSVYMTVMQVRAATGEPYEESDMLTQGTSTVLSYEGVLR